MAEEENKLDIAVLQSEFSSIKEVLTEIHKDVKSSGREVHSIKDQLNGIERRVSINEITIRNLQDQSKEFDERIDFLVTFATQVRTWGTIAIIGVGLVQFLVQKFL